MTTGNPLLRADDLHRSYPQRGRSGGQVEAVAGVGFALGAGEAFGIVGQSGAGKSTLARLLLALETPDHGCVRFNGHLISSLPEREVRALRRGFQAVFQDPSTSLDPRLTVETIVAEPLIAHRIGDARERRVRVRELLDRVGLPGGSEISYPSAFSGGERQRIAIARALAPEPQLLILDEPVSSLDVSVQAQILDLISELRRNLRLTIVLIAHDLAVVRDVCDRVAVMHRGRFVETGPIGKVLSQPTHPYTRTLLQAALRR
ncbi:MAG: ABC transporter ATP-binding protein [Thermoanaerobaculales bacterium]